MSPPQQGGLPGKGLRGQGHHLWKSTEPSLQRLKTQECVRGHLDLMPPRLLYTKTAKRSDEAYVINLISMVALAALTKDVVILSVGGRALQQ